MSETDTIELATELTIAWLGNPSTRAGIEEVEAFLRTMNRTVEALASPAEAQAEGDRQEGEHLPAVSVRKSLASPEHIISMIDGKPYRTLKRHLTGHGLTPDEYRRRYGLKADYPMVAPAYSEKRRETAKRLGLGRKPGSAAATTPAAAADATAGKPRKRRSAGEARAAAKDHLNG